MLIPLLLSLLGVTQGQHYCCAPAQWEANMGQLESYYRPKSHDFGLIQGVDVVSMDSLNQRMVVTANLLEDGKPLPPTTIHNDYANKVQWKISSGNCSKAFFPSPMPYRCIPATANYTGSTYFGVGQQKLMLDLWRFEFPNVRLSTGNTQNGCYPVTQGIVGEFGPDLGSFAPCKTDDCTDVVIAYGITGLTVGIKSQSVFDLPDSCQTPASHDDSMYLRNRLGWVREKFKSNIRAQHPPGVDLRVVLVEQNPSTGLSAAFLPGGLANLFQ